MEARAAEAGQQLGAAQMELAFLRREADAARADASSARADASSARAQAVASAAASQEVAALRASATAQSLAAAAAAASPPVSWAAAAGSPRMPAPYPSPSQYSLWQHQAAAGAAFAQARPGTAYYDAPGGPLDALHSSSNVFREASAAQPWAQPSGYATAPAAFGGGAPAAEVSWAAAGPAYASAPVGAPPPPPSQQASQLGRGGWPPSPTQQQRQQHLQQQQQQHLQQQQQQRQQQAGPPPPPQGPPSPQPYAGVPLALPSAVSPPLGYSQGAPSPAVGGAAPGPPTPGNEGPAPGEGAPFGTELSVQEVRGSGRGRRRAPSSATSRAVGRKNSMGLQMLPPPMPRAHAPALRRRAAARS
jgi:hypothetical protein